MAKKKPAKKPQSINQRFTSLERVASHVEGFRELQKILDIELKAMKEQMNRFEDRLACLEAAQAS